MFYYLDGAVALMGPNLAVIDCGGVGYACAVSTNTLSRLEVGKKARLFTYCNIREDAFDIFGFYDASEKRCFELLIAVSGVGPKAALAILSVCTPESLALAVLGDDTRMITTAPGVGKKIAQRIVMELKDKVAKEAAGLAASGYVPPAPSAESARADEAAAALAVLGYTQGEVAALLRKLDTENLTTEEIVRAALKQSLR
ncbi:MAG: Holliday junction branch migration protein RuvA [Oscillospiraceae bacterium]|jgi:Holliday junction DNA helicase RuvA|nr:Holliday junction branch migration protein RuvA [Oscillospiraceae bacterium]